MFNPKEFEKFAEENQESIKEVRKKLKKENDRNKPIFLEKVEKEFFSGKHTEEDISKFNKLMRKIKKDI